MKKLQIGILFGGRSGEHEVSLLSAASVLEAINRSKYEIRPIGITKAGAWVTGPDADRLLRGELKEQPLEATSPDAALAHLDAVLPILHGTFGEDGTLQGLLELANIAYAGSGVLGSAAGMDKDIMKRLFASAGLPNPKHQALLRSEWKSAPKKVVERLEAALKYPLFVKPANGGSSVGISKAHTRKELGPAIELAAQYDRKIVVEQAIGGGKGAARSTGKPRELEVAVLGNDKPEASVVGEVIPVKEFYDYEAKYMTEGSALILPAKITAAQKKAIRTMAVQAFQACDCAGLARVDFLMEPGGKGRIYLNEINTMPGFTAISMYPKLWAATGLPYPDLIDRLITLALERHAERSATSYSR